MMSITGNMYSSHVQLAPQHGMAPQLLSGCNSPPPPPPARSLVSTHLSMASIPTEAVGMIQTPQTEPNALMNNVSHGDFLGIS